MMLRPLSAIAVILTLLAMFIAGPVQAQSDVSSGGALDNLDKPGKSFLIPDCLRNAESVRTTTGVATTTNTGTTSDCVTETITFYTNLMLLVAGFLAFLYMLYGAFLYATAFGDDAKATQAKKVVTHAMIGIFLAGMSALLVQLIKSLLQA